MISRPRGRLEVFALLAVALTLPVVSGHAADGRVATNPGTYQLLVNPDLEDYDPPYAWFEGSDCQVGSGWQRFWYDGPEPYWLDTRVYADGPLGTGWVERIKGETSQLIVGTEAYTAGIWQQVTGLTPGVAYGFYAAMLTIYQTSAPPAVDGTMVKQVGIDPTGGTDPRAPTVMWSEPDDHDEGPWELDQRTAVVAQGPTMTAFVRVISPYASGGLPYLNYSFLDSAILAQTPLVSAVSPAVSPEPSFPVRWDNAVPAPGARRLRWYDVQWLDEADADAVWHDWFVRTAALQAAFTGERGHTYRFRARVWQQYLDGAHLYGPYSPQGDTSTTVTGSSIVGHVLDGEEHPVRGATVAISGTTYAASSDRTGHYRLDVPPSPAPMTVTVQHLWLTGPAPAYGLTLGVTETAAITWTLRPPDDAVLNGGFEKGVDGWSSLATPGIVPTVVADPVHTGHAAMLLGVVSPDAAVEAATSDPAVAVSQTVALSDAWDPVLSFWYRPVVVAGLMPQAAAAPGGFEVFLTTVDYSATPPLTTTRVFTPETSVDRWQHVWYYPYQPRAALTGTVSVEFRLTDPAAISVYLDEVSLGSTPGGPHATYLPLLLRWH